MNLHDWGALIAICTVGAISPGPSLLVIISISAKFGRKAGLLSAVGHGTAVFIYAITTALGISFLSGAANYIFFYVKLAGALFLFWIGLSMFMSRYKARRETENSKVPQKLGFAFRDGFLIGILNPKIAAFFATLFSQFVVPTQEFTVSFLMASIAGMIDMTAYCLAALISNTLLVKHLFLSHSHIRDSIFGLLLILLALSVMHDSFNL